MSDYFISDLHYGHKNIINLCNRPFDSLEEMNQSIIEIINTTCQPNDTLYHLGDVSMNKTNYENFIKQIHCKIVFINGNHDKRFVHGEDMLELKCNKTHVIMCHYPIYSWNKMSKGSIHLYGHTHQILDNMPPNAFCVCYDVIKRPMQLHEIVNFYSAQVDKNKKNMI